MILTDLRTHDLPPTERFASWSSTVATMIVPVRVRTDHQQEHDFLGTALVRELGTARLAALSFPSLRGERSSRLISQGDPEMYQLICPLSGTAGLAQADHETVLGSRELAFKDTSRPYRFRATAPTAHAPHAGVVAQFPKALLPLPAAQAARLTATRFPTDRGIGALLFTYVSRLAQDTAQYRAGEAARLGNVLVDLFAALLAETLESDRALPPESRRNTLLLRIHAFIHRHLADPELTPSVIAAAHHISLRHLHRLFQEDGTSVATWIRGQRLEHCRDALTDPGRAREPIHAIAARWGFTQPTDFSRAFRGAYGVSPRDYRQTALVGRDGAQRQKPCAYC